MFRRKDHNVAGLQIADLLASTQKVEIVEQNGRPVAKATSPFAARFNAPAGRLINAYGRYLLDRGK